MSTGYCRQTFFLPFFKINAEFLRITTVPLQARFLASLDKHHSKLVEIIRKRGGTVREKTRDILKVLDQSLDVNLRSECLLKCLIVYLGKNVDQLLKEYLVVQKDEAESEREVHHGSVCSQGERESSPATAGNQDCD